MCHIFSPQDIQGARIIEMNNGHPWIKTLNRSNKILSQYTMFTIVYITVIYC